MKSNETNQTQRSEEINWTERELSLAEQLDIEPEAVRLIDSLRERVDENAKTEITKRLREITGSESDIGEVEHEQLLAKRFNVPIEKVRKLGGLASVLLERMLKEAEQDDKAEPANETQEEQEAAENTTGVPGLDKMIADSLLEDAIALYVGIEIEKSNTKLGEKIQSFVRNLLPELFEQLKPQNIKASKSADMELDIMPAVNWLRFLDGFKAALIQFSEV